MRIARADSRASRQCILGMPLAYPASATLGSGVPFIDEARIGVKAGDGGNRCMAFRRE